MNVEPFAITDGLEPESDIDEGELARTVNATDDLNDRPHGLRRSGTFDHDDAFDQIADYQFSRRLKTDRKVFPKGATERRLAADRYAQQTVRNPSRQQRVLGRGANLPLQQGVGPGEANRAGDVRAAAQSALLAGKKVSVPTVRRPDTPDHKGAAKLAPTIRTLQREHGEKPDGIIRPGGPTQSTLSHLTAPQLDYLAGRDPMKPKPFELARPQMVARTLAFRPTTVRTFEQAPETLPTVEEYDAAVGLLGTIDRKVKEAESDEQLSRSDGEDILAVAADRDDQMSKLLGVSRRRLPTIENALIAAMDRRQTGPQLKPYDPLPSEDRSFWLRRNMGEIAGGGANDLAEWFDPITPVADFVHRRTNGAPYTLEDVLVLLSLAGGAGQVSRLAARKLDDVLEEGRYYRGADGSIDLGFVASEISETSGGTLKGAKIRMELGEEGLGGFGARHISPDKHERARALGYKHGWNLIEDVARNHELIIQQHNNRLMLVLPEGQNRYAVAEWHPARGWNKIIGKDDQYTITTGFPDTVRNANRPNRSSASQELKKGGSIVWKKSRLQGEQLSPNAPERSIAFTVARAWYLFGLRLKWC